MLSLCWSDGVSLIPLAFRHLASADEKNQRCGVKIRLDKRSLAYRIRKEAVSKAPEVLLGMLNAPPGLKVFHSFSRLKKLCYE